MLRLWADRNVFGYSFTNSNIGVELCLRYRATIAEVNAGFTLVPAPGPGFKYRIIDMNLIAVGGAVTSATDVRVLGTRAAASVALLVAAVAALTQSALLRAGAANAVILADGASFTSLDENTAITGAKTGASVTVATAVDFLLCYVIERV